MLSIFTRCVIIWHFETDWMHLFWIFLKSLIAQVSTQNKINELYNINFVNMLKDVPILFNICYFLINLRSNTVAWFLWFNLWSINTPKYTFKFSTFNYDYHQRCYLYITRIILGLVLLLEVLHEKLFFQKIAPPYIE